MDEARALLEYEEAPADQSRLAGAGEDNLTRLFQIHEQDLADLESILPQLADALATPSMTNRQRVQLRQVQKIVSDVRWDYGPPGTVKIVPANDQPL